LINLVL